MDRHGLRPRDDETVRRPRDDRKGVIHYGKINRLSALHGPGREGRTCPAIAHVAAHFDRKIALDHVAALCQLSPSQFCRVFRQEQGVSFGQ
jgi:AraC-like DNA-binding protein